MRLLAAAFLLTTMPAASALNPGVALGVDLGTSGVRVAVVEADGASTNILGEAATGWSDADGNPAMSCEDAPWPEESTCPTPCVHAAPVSVITNE